MGKTKTKTKDIWYEHNGERHRVVAIEYQDGHPVNVVTEEHWDHSRKPWFNPAKDRATGTCAEFWDFDWSRTAGTLYFHNSGGGGGIEFHVCRFVEPSPPKAELWVAEGVPIVRTVGRVGGKFREQRVSDATLLKMGYRRIARPKLLTSWLGDRTRNPFEAGEEGETIYCDRCKDSHASEWTDNPCEHIEWCDGCALWVYEDDRHLVGEIGKCDCEQESEDES